MTQQEFTQRTMVEVSNQEYEAIEVVYLNSELDKDEFCKMWCKMNPNRVKNAKVEKIMREKEIAYKEVLFDGFDNWREKAYTDANYFLPIEYTKLTTYLVQAFSFAGIKLEGFVREIHWNLGLYLGVYHEN